MKNSIVLPLSAIAIAVGLFSAQRVQSQSGTALVRLQSTSPGISQGGSTNISGNALVGGRLGVGTLAPLASLHVAGGLMTTGTNADIGVPQNEAIQFGHYQGANFIERMRVDSNGGIGINTTTPDGALDVNGNLHLTGGQIQDLLPR